MESPKLTMPEVSDSERNPLVDAWLEVMAWQQEQIEEREQQILKLKGETTQPKIKPSRLDKETDTDENKEPTDKKGEKGKRRAPNARKQNNCPFMRPKS
jgi:hypothetical protein